jgi:hypothetical protein
MIIPSGYFITLATKNRLSRKMLAMPTHEAKSDRSKRTMTESQTSRKAGKQKVNSAGVSKNMGRPEAETGELATHGFSGLTPSIFLFLTLTSISGTFSHSAYPGKW